MARGLAMEAPDRRGQFYVVPLRYAGDEIRVKAKALDRDHAERLALNAYTGSALDYGSGQTEFAF